MTTIKKTILIEANREESIEVKDYGTNTSLSSKNKAEWTNILKDCNLKKGDVLSFDSACINSKGSNPDSIEFDGVNVSETRKYTDNFCIMKFGHYINHNLEYAVGLPCFDKETGVSTQFFLQNNPFSDDTFSGNTYYGQIDPSLIPKNPFNEPFLFDGDYGNQVQQGGFTTPELLISSSFFTRQSNHKYAVINRKYKGHTRRDMNPVTDYDASMSYSEFRIKMETGFQQPSNLAARITAILHQTNTADDFLNNNVILGNTRSTTLNKIEQQAFVNGKALINVAVNGVFVDDTQDVFYQSIATDDPERFENGVNILLQTELINLEGDLQCNNSTATQSIENISTMAGATINAGTTTIIFVFDTSIHADVVATYKVGMEIVFVSGTNIFDTTRKTIITASTPGALGQLALQFTGQPTTVNLTATDPACVIRAQGPGEYITNTPIFLFGNKNPPGEETLFDNYSPHTDPESFDLNGFSFLNGIDPTKQPRSFGKWTFTRVAYENLNSNGSIEYNHTVLIELSDGGTTFGFREIYPEVFLKWTGSNFESTENYLACRDTEDNIYTIPFEYDNNAEPKGVSLTDSNFYDYNPNFPTPDNEWTNASNGHDRIFTKQDLSTNYAYDYRITSSDDPSIDYSINAQIGKTEILRLYDTATNSYLGFGELFIDLNGTKKIVWNGTITTTPTQFFRNETFQNYSDPNLPDWTFDPSNTDFDAADLGNGIITRTAAAGTIFIRQTSISGLQVGTTYVFKMKREDALPGTMFIRTQNGLNNVNVLWDNGSTTNLRVVNTGGAGNFTPDVSFEVLTACDGIEIYFQAQGQSISEVSLLQQGAGGGSVSETVWNLAQDEDVRKIEQIYIFELVGTDEPPEIDGQFADMRLGQILPTNIAYTEDNLKLIQKFMNNTEVYDGNETLLDKIAVDDDNYHVRIDLGRTNDFPLDGGVEVPDPATGHVLTSNPVDTTPQIPAWIKNRSLTDDTIVNPRKFTPTGNREQRIKCRSRYKADATNRLNYNGTTGINEVDLRNTDMTLNENLFFFDNPTDGSKFDDSLSQKLNVGVYPIYYKEILNKNNPNGTEDIDFKIHRIIAFELVEELTSPQTQIFKIQWGIPAIFSPSMADCNQLLLLNPEMPLIPPYIADPELDPDFQYNILNNCNFIQVGAQNPTMDFNQTLQRFTFTELHTPIQLNARDATESNGEVVCQFGSRQQGIRIQAGMFRNEVDPDLIFSRIAASNMKDGQYYVIIDVGANTPWTTMGATNGTKGEFFLYTAPSDPIPANATGIAGQGLNPGRNDSQAGIYLQDIFFQVEQGEKDIDNSESEGSVLMTRDNFYNSIMFKCGFDFYTLKPIRFNDNPFNNRYNPYYQNRYIEPNGRIYTLSPITTNSDFDIANSTSLNIFPQYRAQKGLPKFKLGYNNNESVNIEVNSYSITADQLPSQLNSGFYRVYVDFPLSTLDYIAGGNKLNCAAYILRNYQTGSFFFTYSSSYNIPITKDTPLNAIRISIRTADGRVARNLNPKCVVFFKIEREVPILPTLIEQEEEIKELKVKDPKSYDNIMEQFNKQIEAKDKQFKEAQAQALAEGVGLLQVPVGDGYLGQQNTVTIQEPQPINLLGIPQLLEPNQIIQLQQHAEEPSIVEAVGNLPPPPLQFDFDPPPIEPEPIQSILQPAPDVFVPGLIPSEDPNLPIQETQYDFSQLNPQEVPLIDLNPEPEPIEFGNIQITPEQPDLFTRAARYTQQVETLLTDEKNKLKIRITKNVIRNIANTFSGTGARSQNELEEQLVKALTNSAKTLANRLELIYDQIDKATTQKQYTQLKKEIQKLTKNFNFTPGGDVIERTSTRRSRAVNLSAPRLNALTLLFYEQGGGFGTELSQAFSNQFTLDKIKAIIESPEFKPVIFNRQEIGRRSMEIKERENITRRQMEAESSGRRRILYDDPYSLKPMTGTSSMTTGTPNFTLNVSEIPVKETRQQLLEHNEEETRRTTSSKEIQRRQQGDK